MHFESFIRLSLRETMYSRRRMTIQVYFSDIKLEFFQNLYQFTRLRSHLSLNNNAEKLLRYCLSIKYNFMKMFPMKVKHFLILPFSKNFTTKKKMIAQKIKQ